MITITIKSEDFRTVPKNIKNFFYKNGKGPGDLFLLGFQWRWYLSDISMSHSMAPRAFYGGDSSHWSKTMRGRAKILGRFQWRPPCSTGISPDKKYITTTTATTTTSTTTTTTTTNNNNNNNNNNKSKKDEYLDLAKELKMLWKVTVILIIIGALGTIPKSLINRPEYWKES